MGAGGRVSHQTAWYIRICDAVLNPKEKKFRNHFLDFEMLKELNICYAHIGLVSVLVSQESASLALETRATSQVAIKNLCIYSIFIMPAYYCGVKVMQ